MKPRLLFLTSAFTDIRVNLALEDYLFKKYKLIHKQYNLVENPQIIFLWRNTPSVIIGRNQNAYTECNVNEIKKDGVNLARRLTGGGAVFQDLGNTCFTFLNDSKDYNVDQNNQLILKALESFGVIGEPSGRNDLVVDNKKFSGSAFKNLNNVCLHHGTLLFNVNVANMLKYLTPDVSKLQKHGVKSVESRTINLSTINPIIHHESFTETILKETKNLFNDIIIEKLSHIPEKSELYQKLKSDEWNYGEQKEYSLVFKNRFSWGSLEINLLMDQEQVKGGKVYSDSLDLDFIQEIQKLLDKKGEISKLHGFDQWNEVECWLESVKSPFPHLPVG